MTDSKGDAMLDNQTRKIAESVTLVAVARLSMALTLPTLGLIAWFASAWLDGKFEIQDGKIAQQAAQTSTQTGLITTRVETLERTHSARMETLERSITTAQAQSSQTNDRLIAVETKQTQDSAARAQFESATLTRLDRMQDSLVVLSNSIASLTATLQAEQQNRRTRFSSSPALPAPSRD